MPIYEITVETPDGNWHYWRGEYPDFQAACLSGITRTASSSQFFGGRLRRVEVLAGGGALATGPDLPTWLAWANAAPKLEG